MGGKTTKDGLRKKSKGKKKMVDDEPKGRKSVKTSHKRKEKMYEFPGLHQPRKVRSATMVQRSTMKLDACNMSPHELVKWEQQEAGSPYLRTPLLKPRRKGIEFPCKNLFGDFLHCDCVAYEVVLHDNWQYEGLDLDGYIDVGSFVTDTLAYTLPLVLKKKCKNKVNVTRKTRWLNNLKTMRLRKGCGKRVACGANNQRLGSFIGLNVHAVNDIHRSRNKYH
nr:hypothetical protein [Tanacetum cinerariifolium]